MSSTDFPDIEVGSLSYKLCAPSLMWDLSADWHKSMDSSSKVVTSQAIMAPRQRSRPSEVERARSFCCPWEPAQLARDAAASYYSKDPHTTHFRRQLLNIKDGLRSIFLMGLRVPYWRKVADPHLALLDRFSWHLRKQDLEVFQDMMRQCELYSSYTTGMGFPVKEIPLLIAIIFGQHKMILELQKKCGNLIGTVPTKEG